ncbi:hypothetical protein [Paraburkholderia nodosa]|uniref:hypothetical protein n=1 Tax=Paraburkholderia nodosa TaxID=392320 RepID=UPI0008420C0A|nr:hypothetical protein [Paraburkholderia nodosa]
MSTFSEADLADALSDYWSAVSEAVEVAKAWHEKLEAGAAPSAAEVSEFHACGDTLNKRVAQAWDRYCHISALMYRL